MINYVYNNVECVIHQFVGYRDTPTVQERIANMLEVTSVYADTTTKDALVYYSEEPQFWIALKNFISACTYIVFNDITGGQLQPVASAETLLGYVTNEIADKLNKSDTDKKIWLKQEKQLRDAFSKLSITTLNYWNAEDYIKYVANKTFNKMAFHILQAILELKYHTNPVMSDQQKRTRYILDAATAQNDKFNLLFGAFGFKNKIPKPLTPLEQITDGYATLPDSWESKTTNSIPETDGKVVNDILSASDKVVDKPTDIEPNLCINGSSGTITTSNLNKFTIDAGSISYSPLCGSSSNSNNDENKLKGCLVLKKYSKKTIFVIDRIGTHIKSVKIKLTNDNNEIIHADKVVLEKDKITIDLSSLKCSSKNKLVNIHYELVCE